MQWETMLYTASTWALPVVIAITLHEAAHGFVAHRLGDDTAYRLVTMPALRATRGQAWRFLYADEHAPWD
jgi:hypothetical protein